MTTMEHTHIKRRVNELRTRLEKVTEENDPEESKFLRPYLMGELAGLEWVLKNEVYPKYRSRK